MSEQNEVLEIVKEAQSINKFNLADAIKGRVFPEDTVDIYLDIESAYKLSKIQDIVIDALTDEDAEKLEAETAELSAKILKSKLTFYMRGIDQKRIEEIEASIIKDDETDEWVTIYFCALVAANIVKVVDANGNEDDHEFTSEEVANLRDSIPAESWNLLIATMQKLTLATGYFKGLTDAGFLQKF